MAAAPEEEDEAAVPVLVPVLEPVEVLLVLVLLPEVEVDDPVEEVCDPVEVVAADAEPGNWMLAIDV